MKNHSADQGVVLNFFNHDKSCSFVLFVIHSRERWRGGEHMSPSERRQKLIEVLCCRRHDTYYNLAFEFNVSTRTICRDIAALMCSYPLETVRGRYGGGVKVADGYYLYHRSLNVKQISLLTKLANQLIGDDLDTMNSILVQFAP